MSTTVDVISPGDIRKAMDAVRNAPYRVCPHIVHPRYAGWVHADDLHDPEAVVMSCAALCGTVLVLSPPRAAGHPRSEAI